MFHKGFEIKRHHRMMSYIEWWPTVCKIPSIIDRTPIIIYTLTKVANERYITLEITNTGVAG